MLLPAVGSIRENVSENLSKWLSVRRLHFSRAYGEKCIDLLENSQFSGLTSLSFQGKSICPITEALAFTNPTLRFSREDV